MTVKDKFLFALKLLSISIAAIAIIGNVLVCHVIVRLKSMKTSINYIILNLAILDTISGIASIYYVFFTDYQGVLIAEPLPKQVYNQSSILADVLCKIEVFYWFPVSVSPMLLMIMAYERYKAIVDPLSRRGGSVTKARLKWMLPIAWATGIAYVIADMSAVEYVESLGYCWYVKGLRYFESAMTSWIITQMALPSTAILIFYAGAILTLKKQNNALGPQAGAERVRRNAKRKVMRIIIAVTLVFYLCCGIPQVGFGLANVTHVDNVEAATFFEDIRVILLAVNLVFNPIAYFVFMQSFRNGFRRVFKLQRQNSNRCNVLAIWSASSCSVDVQSINMNRQERQNNKAQLLTFIESRSQGSKNP